MGGHHSGRATLEGGAESTNKSWGKLGKENPRQKEQQEQKPKDREGSDTTEKKEAGELKQSQEERSVNCSWTGRRGCIRRTSQGTWVLTLRPSLLLLPLFLELMVMWETLHWVQFKPEA